MKDYAAGKVWKIEKRQRIMEVAYRLFCDRGIVPVTMPEVAKESDVARATLFRYFPTKVDLVVAVNIWKWEEYIELSESFVPDGALERMTGAEYMRFYHDAFITIYRKYPDILRFNYDLNSYLWREQLSTGLISPYLSMFGVLKDKFHDLYERGIRDGTINGTVTEETMFSVTFHIMLAAVTRYAMGLIYAPEKEREPESDLVMLRNAMLREFTCRGTWPDDTPENPTENALGK